MEGLIPLVYKTLKKNKTRRQYECLSSGAAQSHKIGDFYGNGQSRSQSESHHVFMKTPTAEKIGGLNPERNGHRQRRYMSMECYSSVDGMMISNDASSPTPFPKLTRCYSSVDGMMISEDASSPTPLPKLTRFRSHRMFSCLTGA